MSIIFMAKDSDSGCGGCCCLGLVALVLIGGCTIKGCNERERDGVDKKIKAEVSHQVSIELSKYEALTNSVLRGIEGPYKRTPVLVPGAYD
jgi:hypothetical protein